MVRVSRGRKIILMALITIRIRQLIVSAGVAGLAVNRPVLPRKSKPGRRMIERRRLPGERRMARPAVAAEHSRLMVRRLYSHEVRRVTIVAGR